MKFEGKKFDLLSDRELPATLGGATFIGCTFMGSYGMTAQTPAERRRISDVQLIDCKAMAKSWLGPVIVEDVDMQNFGTTGLCIAWETAFKRVRMRGKCGTFMLGISPHRDESFQEANREFYEGVDWALDISEGEFAGLELRGMPVDLVRRDPETQVIVRRANVLRFEKKWRGVAMIGNWTSPLHNLLEWGLEDQVFIAPKRSRNFSDKVKGLRLLQRLGIADRD